MRDNVTNTVIILTVVTRYMKSKFFLKTHILNTMKFIANWDDITWKISEIAGVTTVGISHYPESV